MVKEEQIMRICPKCGYKDYPCWRQRMYSLYTDYCKLDELEFWDKGLVWFINNANDIRQMGKQQIKFYTDGIYNYGLREDNTVIRIAREDAREPDSLKEPPKETGHKGKRK